MSNLTMLLNLNLLLLSLLNNRVHPLNNMHFINPNLSSQVPLRVLLSSIRLLTVLLPTGHHHTLLKLVHR